MGELAKDRPTIAFHASLNHAFGKGALISLLRQFGKLHEDKKEISVGVIGYPNVGKSSVINTLCSKKSCRVAPIPGETKIWQYVTLFKRISLIDCPGVVVDTAGDTETDSVLKGVVRAERLENPEDYIEAIQERVQRVHIAAQYKITNTWDTTTELLEMIATKFGRLRKGGDPCIRSAAIMMIHDFIRGRLPHYVAPPELKEDETDTAVKRVDGNIHIDQDLDQMERTKDDGKRSDEEEDVVSEAEEDLKDSNDGKPQAEASESRDEALPASAELIGAGEWED